MKLKSLSESLSDTMKNSDLSGIKGMVEFGIDTVLNDGVLKSIPVVSVLSSLCSARTSIRDELFQRKLLGFLAELGETPAAVRQKMIGRIDADPAFTNRVGENILLLLDRADDMQKPMLLARTFCAYCEEKISLNDLQRISSVLDRVFVPDLVHLKEFISTEYAPEAVIQNYINCGLAWAPPGLTTTTVKATSIANVCVNVICPRS